MAKVSVPDEQESSSSVQPHAGVASLAHWAFLISFVVPFTSLIIPLVLLNTTGKEDAFVRDNAKEALNLFICSLIGFIVFGLLCIIIIGIPLIIALAIYILVLPIVAAIQTMASTMDSKVYRYPWIFRLIK